MHDLRVISQDDGSTDIYLDKLSLKGVVDFNLRMSGSGLPEVIFTMVINSVNKIDKKGNVKKLTRFDVLGIDEK
tara:strand:+ start:26949 stop:27170 length:222 start_codon:yes stop_codon:yes gene_type:complete